MEKALRMFEGNLGIALPYLEGRGITERTAVRHRLGVVCSDAPDAYLKYDTRLVIPYMDKKGVCAFKFRCLAHAEKCPKECDRYLNPGGQDVTIYGATDLDDDVSETLHVTEGEFDRIALSQCTDEPVIGLPGADAWKDHWVCHFSGFSRVVFWRHGDAAGEKWARRMRDKCRVAEIVDLPPKEDVNSIMLLWGPEKLMALANGEDDE